jgi:F0F1-type ATP synthase membrane subunit b/b'
VSTQAEVTKTSVQGPPSSATTQLEQILATFMTVMQQSNAQLREDLSSNQKRAEQFQESIKADILTMQEILLERFDQQTQEHREEFNSKLDAESRRVTNLVNQVPNDATS